MARFSKDRGSASQSIGAALAATSPKENAGITAPTHNGSSTGGPNGDGTGAGDSFVYVPGPGSGFQFPPNLSWSVSVAGGTMTALTVTLEGSNDGFTTTSTVDTQNSATGGTKAVANPGFREYRCNITTFTKNTGTPIVTALITM